MGTMSRRGARLKRFAAALAVGALLAGASVGAVASAQPPTPPEPPSFSPAPDDSRSTPAPPAEELDAADSKTYDLWITDLDLIGFENGLLTFRVVETVLMTSPNGDLGTGFTHSLLAEAHPNAPDPLERIVGLRASMVAEGREVPVDATVTAAALDPAGMTELRIDVRDSHDALDAVEYRLSYTYIVPFLPMDPGDPASESVGFISLGPVLHDIPVLEYQANLRWEHDDEIMFDCTITGLDAVEECLTDDDGERLILRPMRELLADEHLLLLLYSDNDADGAVPPGPKPGASEAPIAEPVASEPLGLDAPAWTAFAAGGGLAALGGLALVLARREADAEAGVAKGDAAP